MKTVKTVAVFLVIYLSISCLTFQKTNSVKAEEKNNLKLERIMGISEKSGVFRLKSSDGWNHFPDYQQGLAVASDGTIYIGDSAESQIEMFDSNLNSIGIFGSLGTGDGQFQNLLAITLDNKDQIYAVDGYLCTIQVFSKDGKFIRKFGTKGELIENLQLPTDIAVLDTGDFLVCDLYGGLKVFDQEGEFIRNFSIDDNLQPEMRNYPNRVKLGKDGFVYVSSITNDRDGRILKLDQNGKLIGFILGDENDSSNVAITDFAIDNQFLYITDCSWGNRKVLKYKLSLTNESAEFVDTIASLLPKLKIEKTNVRAPTAVFAQDKKVYYLDGDINRLVVVTEDNEFIGSIESPVMQYGLAYQANPQYKFPDGYFSAPYGIVFDKEENLLVVNSAFQIVNKFSKDGAFIQNIGKIPASDKILVGECYFPKGIGINKDGYIFVSDSQRHCVQVFSPDTKPLLTIQGVYMYPYDIAFDKEGHLIVISAGNSTMHIIDISHIANKEYEIINSIRIPGDWPSSFLIVNDKIWIIDSNYDRVYIMNSEGEIIKEIGSIGTKPGQFTGPNGVCADKEGNVYICETVNGRIQKFTAEGNLIWCEEMGWFGLSRATIDSEGHLFVSDCIHNVIAVFTDLTNKTPEDEKPEESNANFSLQLLSKEVKQGNGIWIDLHGEKLEKVVSLDLIIKYSKNNLAHNPLFHKITLGELCDNGRFQITNNEISDDSLEITLLSENKEEIFGNGKLLSIEFKATKQGIANINIEKLVIKNKNGKEIKYQSKTDLQFTILENDTTPPLLKIKPVPSVVYDPNLLIEGETEPGASVTINQKEVVVSGEGKFNTQIELVKGDNSILVLATDKAGNQAKQTITVILKDRIIIELTIGSRIMTVNEKPSMLDSVPFIDKVSGRTMVPIRAISEAIGAEVKFIPKDQSIMISLEPIILVLWIGKPNALINGLEIPIDPSGKVAPVIVGDRTFVPLRFVAESFNFQVAWDPKTQGITMTYPDPGKE
jgi:tripartite motif-containing protein 71